MEDLIYRPGEEENVGNGQVEFEVN